MKVRVRCPHVPVRVVVGGAVIAALLALLSVTAALVALALVACTRACFWFASRVGVEVRGGGFRPLRTVDLIEFNSLDQLIAYDRKQASR